MYEGKAPKRRAGQSTTHRKFTYLIPSSPPLVSLSVPSFLLLPSTNQHSIDATTDKRGFWGGCRVRGGGLAVARRLIGVCVPAKLAALTVRRGRYLMMQWDA